MQMGWVFNPGSSADPPKNTSTKIQLMLMPFQRLVAVLLVPCLVVDPSLASAPMMPTVHPMQTRLREEALNFAGGAYGPDAISLARHTTTRTNHLASRLLLAVADQEDYKKLDSGFLWGLLVFAGIVLLLVAPVLLRKRGS